MSDTQQGPDWWLASDMKWYPPVLPPPPTHRPGPAASFRVLRATAAVMWFGAILCAGGGFLAQHFDHEKMISCEGDSLFSSYSSSCSSGSLHTVLFIAAGVVAFISVLLTVGAIAASDDT